MMKDVEKLNKIFRELEARVPPEEREKLKEKGVWEYREGVVLNALKEVYRALRNVEEDIGQLPPEMRKEVAGWFFMIRLPYMASPVALRLDGDGHIYLYTESDSVKIASLGEDDFAKTLRTRIESFDLEKISKVLQTLEAWRGGLVNRTEKVKTKGVEEEEEEERKELGEDEYDAFANDYEDLGSPF